MPEFRIHLYKPDRTTIIRSTITYNINDGVLEFIDSQTKSQVKTNLPFAIDKMDDTFIGGDPFK